MTALPERVLARWKAEDWNDRTMEADKYTYFAMDEYGYTTEIELTDADLARYSWGITEDDLIGGSQMGTLR